MENVPEALRLELANVAAKIEAENFMVLGWRNNAVLGVEGSGWCWCY